MWHILNAFTTFTIICCIYIRVYLSNVKEDLKAFQFQPGEGNFTLCFVYASMKLNGHLCITFTVVVSSSSY